MDLLNLGAISLLFLVSLYPTISQEEETCSNVINTISGWRKHLGMDKYARLAESYYGDHIPWGNFEDLRLTTHKEKRCFIVSTTRWICKNVTISEMVIEVIDTVHNETKHYIDARRDDNNTFHHHSFLRPPASAQRLWEEEVGKSSAHVVLAADYINLALNTILRTNTSESWCLPIYYNGQPSKGGYYRDERRKYCLESSLDEYLNMATYALLNTIHSDEYLNNLKFAVGCLFEHELGLSKITLRSELVEGLKKDEVLKYVERLWKAVQVLSSSPDLQPGLVKFVKTLHKHIKDVDWNKLSIKLYAMIINGRSRALEVDIDGSFQALHEFDMAFQKGIWRFYTGQWPSMEKFFENLVKTIKTDRFWDRLDFLYVDTLNQFKDIYEKRKDKLEIYMDLLRSKIREVTEKVEYISKQVNETAINFENEINKLDIEDMVIAMVDGPGKLVNKHALACITKFYDKPDFHVLDKMVSKEITDAFYDLVFFNWPQEEIIPEGLDAFIETFVSSFWIISSAILGSCPN